MDKTININGGSVVNQSHKEVDGECRSLRALQLMLVVFTITCLGLNIHLAYELNDLHNQVTQASTPTLTYATQSQFSSVFTSSLSAPMQLTLVDADETRHFLSMSLRRNSGSGILDFEVKKNAYCSSDLASLNLASMQLHICDVYVQSSMTTSQGLRWLYGTSIGSMEYPCTLEDPTNDEQKEQYSHCIEHELVM